jgi:drug/metabolite transporter (DMT)-like permease
MFSALLAVSVKLFLGAAQAIIAKMALDWDVSLDESDPKKFGKNFFMAWTSFLSMLLVILPFYMRSIVLRRKEKSHQKPVVEKQSFFIKYFSTSIPAVLDVTAIVLSTWLSKSVDVTFMMVLKSSKVCIAAFLSKFFMKKSLRKFQWAGVAITTVGLIVIAVVSNLKDAEGHRMKTAFLKSRESGDNLKSKSKDLESYELPYFVIISLVLLAEFMRAVRNLYEERLMKFHGITPEYIVVFESISGLMITTGLLGLFQAIKVGKAKTPIENSAETIEQISANQPLLCLLVANFLLTGLCNYATTVVTKELSSVMNGIISQGRAFVVWIPSLIIGAVCMRSEKWVNYRIPGVQEGLPKFGETLGHWYYWVPQLFAFGLVTVGGLLYNKNLKLPKYFDYEEATVTATAHPSEIQPPQKAFLAETSSTDSNV